jgi:PEP-CTERM motif
LIFVSTVRRPIAMLRFLRCLHFRTFLIRPMRIALIALLAIPAYCGTFSFAGAFGADDQKQSFILRLDAPATVTFVTLSYAGGTNAAGDLIGAGGFDPVLSLFTGAMDASGVNIGGNNDGGCGFVGTDLVTGACWDSYFDAVLPAGYYTLVLTQADNLPIGPTLGDGFLREGQGDFTGPMLLGSPGRFWDANLDQRDGHWAVDILNVASAAAVPEPASFAAAAIGLLAVAALRRKHATN